MCNAIFELPQRRFFVFARNFFSSPEFPGMPFSFTKIDHWCIFPLELEAALPQRKWVFAHNFFPKRFLSWGIKTLFAYVQAARSEQQRGRREGVGSSGVGSSGERRNPGAGLAAGREDVRRNF